MSKTPISSSISSILSSFTAHSQAFFGNERRMVTQCCTKQLHLLLLSRSCFFLLQVISLACFQLLQQNFDQKHASFSSYFNGMNEWMNEWMYIQSLLRPLNVLLMKRRRILRRARGRKHIYFPQEYGKTKNKGKKCRVEKRRPTLVANVLPLLLLPKLKTWEKGIGHCFIVHIMN